MCTKRQGKFPQFSRHPCLLSAGKAEEKKRLRLEQMRWHPDKFTGKFGGRLDSKDREKILARVTQTSQLLNALAAE